MSDINEELAELRRITRRGTEGVEADCREAGCGMALCSPVILRSIYNWTCLIALKGARSRTTPSVSALPVAVVLSRFAHRDDRRAVRSLLCLGERDTEGPGYLHRNTWSTTPQSPPRDPAEAEAAFKRMMAEYTFETAKPASDSKN
jgi:hypothetical protein